MAVSSNALLTLEIREIIMSHEGLEPGRAVSYSLPCLFSDTIRTRAFDEFFRRYQGASFCVQTSDGWSWRSSPRIPEFTATFRTRTALDALIGDARETTLGRLFLDGDIELEGNILILLSTAQYTLQHSEGLNSGLVHTLFRISHSFARRLWSWNKEPEKPGWHYTPCPLDLPVSFFTPWLGDSLGHSCASFRNQDQDLEPAQNNSFEHACEWLDINRSDRLLDVECGWGSYVLYAGAHCGIRARGITSNPPQMEVAAERIRRLGLERTCSVGPDEILLNQNTSESFSKICQLGIFEPVAACDLPLYLGRLKSILTPGGLLLLDRMTGAGDSEAWITSLPSEFLSNSISTELDLAESAGFEPILMECLEDQYEETLRIWIDYMMNGPMSENTRLFSNGYRAWMLYLLELATSLDAGQLKIYRILLRRA